MGFGEMLVVLVIVLVLFGAKRVPEIGASIGKGIREFKRGVSDVDRQIREPERPAAAERVETGDVPAAVRAPESTPVREEPKRLI